MSRETHLPLSKSTIVECARHAASPVAARAIAIAGRIAADLGATVLRHRHAPVRADLAPSPADIFLHGGKLDTANGLAPALTPHAILTDAEDAIPPAWRNVPIKVIVSHGVPARFGVPDAAVTDAAVLALSGLLDLIGAPDEAPIPFGGAQASGVAGLAAFSGLMTALARSEPAPETIHVSAVEACLWSNWKSYAERLYLARTPTRQGRLAEWQAIACADGFATLIYLEKDWTGIARLIGDSRLMQPPLDTQAGRRANMAKVYDIIRPWYRVRTRAEIYRLARAEGLPISPVLTVAEVLQDPQYDAQRFFVPPVGAAVPPRARVPSIPTVWDGRRFPPRPAAREPGERNASAVITSVAPATAPLAGTRVLDLGIITAGASTSALLADLGADVIKVESSAYIDPFRAWDRGLGAPDWWNQSRFFQFTNRNKRSIALDLKHPDGKALFLDLVACSDVIVENFRRGVLERLGLGWDALKTRNPRLVLCSITSQGETGPEAGAASYGSTLEANSGLADLTRDGSDRPLISGILLNYPDQIVSIYAAGIVALAVQEQRHTGRGAHLDISQRELASFLIGEPILAASLGVDRPFEQPAALRQDDKGCWHVCLDGGHRVPVWNGNDILAAVTAGQFTLAFARTPDGNDVKGVPFALSSMRHAVSRRAPALGEHNAEVLSDLLGLDADRIAALAASGIIGTAPKGT